MTKLTAVIFLVLMTIVPFKNIRASILTGDQYPFPYHNSLLATILSAINRATMPFTNIRMLVHPERANIPGLPKDPSVQMGFFEQKGKSAPLVFVFAGTGGDGLSGTAMFLGSELSRLGYHVVTLPDTLSAAYVLGLSRSTLPGYLPNDALEYYQFLVQLTASLRATYHLQISGFSVVGLSYGATLAGFLNHVDHQQRLFNFERTVMFNPAMDVGYAMNILDWYNSRGDSIYPQDKMSVLAKVRELIAALRGNLPESSGEAQLSEQEVIRLAIDNTQLQWVIGNSFRGYLQSIIFAGQQVSDQGYLRSTRTDDRKKEARKFSYADYIQTFVAKSMGVKNEPAEIKRLVRRTSLYSVIDELSRDPGAYAIENSDDFLLQNGDIELLKKKFGSRLNLYPWGGHIGNFRNPRNIADFDQIMGRAHR